MTDVLVVRPSSLGDIVYALAIASDIRRAHPRCAIDWVAERAFVPLVATCPDVRRTIPFALRAWRRAPFASATWRDIGAFGRELRSVRYDAVLDLQEQVKGAVIARAARGVRHGFDRTSIREPIATLGDDVHHRVPRDLHFAERCRRLAAAALRYEVEGPPRWNFCPAADVDAPERPYVVVLHMTSREAKSWPESSFRAVVERLDAAGYASVVPWGSADERARSDRIADGVSGAIVPSWMELSHVASLLARAALVIGVDTGLTHLAAALGTPTIAIFTVTDPVLAGVRYAGAHAWDMGGAGTVPRVDDVLDAAARALRLAPRC